MRCVTGFRCPPPESTPQWQSRIYIGLFLLALLSPAGVLAGQDTNLLNKQLKPDEGFLVVSVDTGVPFRSLRLRRPDEIFGDLVAQNQPAGRDVRIIVMPAGHYQWVNMNLGTASWQRTYLWINARQKKQYAFNLVAGRVNYPGDFVIQPIVSSGLYKALMDVPNAFVFFRGSYYVYMIDRFAMLHDELSPVQEQLIRKYGLVYVGPGNDPFPGFYANLTGH